MNRDNIRRTFVFPSTEPKPEEPASSERHPDYDASKAPIRMPRRARRAHLSPLGWNSQGQREAA